MTNKELSKQVEELTKRLRDLELKTDIKHEPLLRVPGNIGIVRNEHKLGVLFNDNRRVLHASGSSFYGSEYHIMWQEVECKLVRCKYEDLGIGDIAFISDDMGFINASQFYVIKLKNGAVYCTESIVEFNVDADINDLEFCYKVTPID